jgi:hypothetical protein
MVIANGVRALDTQNTNDGIMEMADAVGVGGGQIASGLDALAEANYIMANAPAEFKSPVVLTAVTKGGTNEFHGGVYYSFNGASLNTRSFFANSAPNHVFNDYTVHIGGPIRKNKTFFFANWDQESNHNRTAVSVSVPLASWRTGNFGTTKINDPLTGQPFPNNQIPASRINAAALKAQSFFYPNPNFGDPTLQAGNYRETHHNYSTPKSADGRIDQMFSERDSVFARWSYRHITSHTANASYAEPLGTGDQSRNSGTGIVSWTHTFGPRLVNEARGGYARNYNLTYPDLIGSDIISQLGIQGIPTTGMHGLPYITITGLMGTNQASGGLSLDTNFEFTDNLNWIHGGHSFKFGADLIKDQVGGYTVPDIYGTYSFTGTYSKSAYADFLLGLPQSTSMTIPTPSQYLRGTIASFYAQDQWKITPRLTLNYGVRWEIQFPYHDKYGRIFTFDLAQASAVVPDNGLRSINPAYSGNIPVETASKAGFPADSLLKLRMFDLYPRVGIAYKLTADGRTSVRAGYGIYGNTVYGAVAAGMTGGVFSGSRNFTNAITNGVPLVTFDQPMGVSSAAKLTGLGSATGVNPDLRVPYTEQWNVTLERQIRSFAFNAAYIGSHTVNLLYQRNLNQPVPGTNAFSSYVYPAIPVQTILFVDNGGSQSYNSLQLGASHSAGRNLTFSTGFTWAKDLTDQQDQDTYVGQTIQNAYDRDSERGNNRFTPRLRYYFDAVYALPFGHGQMLLNRLPRVAEGILGGWRLSAVAALQTGQYFSPTFSGTDVSNTNTTGAQRPDVVSGVSWKPADQTIANYINLAAFALPGCPANDPLCANTTRANVGRFGNAGVNILEGPPLKSLDMALFKEFHLTERFLVQFEAQGSNVCNHPNFSYPSANIKVPATGATLTSLNGQAPGARSIYLDLRVRF